MTSRYKKFTFDFDTSFYLIDKYAEKISLNIFYKNGMIFFKPDTKYIMVGSYDQVTIDDFLKIKNMRNEWVYINNIINKIYKITFDINKLYTINMSKQSELIDKVKYLINYIAHGNNDNIFYSIGLTSYDEISESILIQKFGKKYKIKNLDKFEFLILDTIDLYPNQLNYKLSLNIK
jgi:hypothetical protein